MSAAALLEAMRLDKKARAGTLSFALPATVGSMAEAERGIPVEDDHVRQVLT
jgi:3-dehydroquinate synthetase